MSTTVAGGLGAGGLGAGQGQPDDTCLTRRARAYAPGLVLAPSPQTSGPHAPVTQGAAVRISARWHGRSILPSRGPGHRDDAGGGGRRCGGSWPVMSGLGEQVRDRRTALLLSQEALAEAIGVSVRSVIRWEQGQAAPHPEYRRRLARVLGIDVDDLARPWVSETPERAHEAPRFWHVPLRRNPYFTGRQTVLQRLARSLEPGDAIPHLYALAGMGGIGKTQTALEYAYRYGDRYSGVFWLPADTREGCLAAFGELAVVLNLPVLH